MPKILCTLPNASAEISGVAFAQHANGMLSEELTAEVAERFASIPGYEIVGGAPAQTDGKDAERAELLEKAEAIGMKVRANWSTERLKTEVEAAERAAVSGND